MKAYLPWPRNTTAHTRFTHTMMIQLVLFSNTRSPTRQSRNVHASSFRDKLRAKLIGSSRTPRASEKANSAFFSKLLIASTEYRVIFNLLNGARPAHRPRFHLTATVKYRRPFSSFFPPLSCVFPPFFFFSLHLYT